MKGKPLEQGLKVRKLARVRFNPRTERDGLILQRELERSRGPGTERNLPGTENLSEQTPGRGIGGELSYNLVSVHSVSDFLKFTIAHVQNAYSSVTVIDPQINEVTIIYLSVRFIFTFT